MINTNIKLKGSPQREIKFPWIGYNKKSERVMLFTGVHETKIDRLVGTVLHDSSGAFPVGCHSDNWSTEFYVKFVGTVTIEQRV